MAPKAKPAVAYQSQAVITMHGPTEVVALADHIKDPRRKVPVVVVTTRNNEPHPLIEMPALRRRIPSKVPIFVIPTGPLTRTFAQAMPEKTHVYGGAARAYPTGDHWKVNPFSAPLRFVYGPQDVAKAIDDLVADVESYLARPAASVHSTQTSPPSPAKGSETELRAELTRAYQEIARLNQANEQVRADAQRHREAAKATERRSQDESATVDSADLFLDPEQRFRFDVMVAWAKRIPAASKADHPLSEYTLGEEFLASLEALDGIDRSKVIDVVVEVLCGLDKDIAGRDLHRLRTGAAGNAPAVTREDGATCWRAALQINTPQARRLHYWKTAQGIELSRVAGHDDMRP